MNFICGCQGSHQKNVSCTHLCRPSLAVFQGTPLSLSFQLCNTGPDIFHDYVADAQWLTKLYARRPCLDIVSEHSLCGGINMDGLIWLVTVVGLPIVFHDISNIPAHSRTNWQSCRTHSSYSAFLPIMQVCHVGCPGKCSKTERDCRRNE